MAWKYSNIMRGSSLEQPFVQEGDDGEAWLSDHSLSPAPPEQEETLSYPTIVRLLVENGWAFMLARLGESVLPPLMVVMMVQLSEEDEAYPRVGALFIASIMIVRSVVSTFMYYTQVLFNEALAKEGAESSIETARLLNEAWFLVVILSTPSFLLCIFSKNVYLSFGQSIEDSEKTQDLMRFYAISVYPTLMTTPVHQLLISLKQQRTLLFMSNIIFGVKVGSCALMLIGVLGQQMRGPRAVGAANALGAWAGVIGYIFALRNTRACKPLQFFCRESWIGIQDIAAIVDLNQTSSMRELLKKGPAKAGFAAIELGVWVMITLLVGARSSLQLAALDACAGVNGLVGNLTYAWGAIATKLIQQYEADATRKKITLVTVLTAEILPLLLIFGMFFVSEQILSPFINRDDEMREEVLAEAKQLMIITLASGLLDTVRNVLSGVLTALRIVNLPMNWNAGAMLCITIPGLIITWAMELEKPGELDLSARLLAVLVSSAGISRGLHSALAFIQREKLARQSIEMIDEERQETPLDWSLREGRDPVRRGVVPGSRPTTPPSSDEEDRGFPPLRVGGKTHFMNGNQASLSTARSASERMAFL
jgi:Na+-driven multidrug efflux pump